MDANPLTSPPLDFIPEEDLSVKVQELLDDIHFGPEEEIVEREIKRKLTKTPEEYAAQEQGKEGKGLSRYKIKKALFDKLGRQYDGMYQCPGCLKRKDDLHLVRVNKNGDKPGIADYILLCGDCRKKRREEQKPKPKWKRGPGIRGGTPESQKIVFLNSIRALVFKRDNYKCVFCEALGKAKSEGHKRLGLVSLIPESRGGKREIDNYATCCSVHRPSKGNEFPLNYIFEKINFRYWMSEQSDELDKEPTATPGAVTMINLHLKARLHQMLQRIVAGKQVERKEAESLLFRLIRDEENRRRERISLRW